MAGYCYGGTINISSKPARANPAPLALPDLTHPTPPPRSAVAPKHVVDVFVSLHPGSLTAAQFEAVDVPHCLILADEDIGFDGIRAGALAILERKKAEGLAVANYLHEGTVHGSYARPFLADARIRKGFEEATRQTGEWFSEHL